jgi:UDP-4-amino-4,6-dideoxy-N-acetyl-beta-L-altrosamine N-acetyltransferase
VIQLRDLEGKDKDKLLAWRNLPEVARYMFTDHHITPEEHAHWFDRILHDRSCRYWIIVLDSVDVGLASVSDIDRQNQRCYWAFYLADPRTRGKGVGSFVKYSILCYVFDELHLNKLCGEVLAFNSAEIKTYEGFGFRQEGVLREHIIKGGAKMDVVAFGILRSEWDAIRPEVETRLRDKGMLDE